MRLRSALVFAFGVALLGCPEKKPDGGGGGIVTNRCDVNLDDTGLFSNVGTTARARIIENPADLIGGQAAEGRLGDVLLENDRIRVVISQPGRHFSPVPFGGWIVDADLKRNDGQPGRDQFGRIGMVYAFGRTINAEEIEILDDGVSGGAAIVAVTGRDALNDFISINRVLDSYLPNVKLVVDPEKALPLKATTYYVLSPGESRVRMFTQFCNEGGEIVSIPLGDLIDEGGTVEIFNPQSCVGSLGNAGCLIDPAQGFGFQGDGVAYGYRGYKFDAPGAPSLDALLNVGGTVGVLAGAESSNGVLTWVDPQAPKRPGTFGMRAGESRGWLRDFYVTRDIAELTSTFLVQDGSQQGRLKVTVTTQDGAKVPGARVGVFGGNGKMVTLLVTDDTGQARADLAPGTYKLHAGLRGHAMDTPVDATVGTNGTAELTLKLGAARTLNVMVKDPFGAPLPAKVTVLCPTGTCPTPASAYGRVYEVEPLPSNVAAFGLVPPSGILGLKLPPGQYEIVVTRGPEYSAWPQTWPNSGQPVDLTTADQTINATLAKVVDSQGWMSADLHVHAVNSADSSVSNEERVLTFLAEGVDVLVSTDHEAVTDFAPTVQALGAQSYIATMIGGEISSFDFGHFNAYPMIARDERRGGPFDWAGGTEGATLRASQIFAGLKSEHPGTVVQLNHPRGRSGVLSQLMVDTDTLATHRDPATLRMDAAPDATAADTKLMDANFDAIEVANGLTASTAVLNDWMTQLSSGRRKAATAVSDTHYGYSVLGGYSRTFVELGVDGPAQFQPAAFAEALKDLRAIGTNGPFVRLSARKLDGSGVATGDPVGLGGTLSVAPNGGEAVELTIDVQAPEWMKFDTIEVFTHADGREALNGASNDEWPATNVHKSVKLDPATLPIEALPDMNGQNFNRIHVVEKVTVNPTADTWYVVIVRGSSSVPTMFPLAYDDVECDGNICTARAGRPYAFTNALFVDADGSGAYDKFPQKIPRSLRVPRASTPAQVTHRVPSLEELNEALREILAHKHED